MPGGEASGPARKLRRSIWHTCARQTMGDRALEQEVLALFVQQALSVRDRIVEAEHQGQAALAHGLKGSARGVGAFAIADCATEIERHPDDKQTTSNGSAMLIEEVRDFIAAINR